MSQAREARHVLQILWNADDSVEAGTESDVVDAGHFHDVINVIDDIFRGRRRQRAVRRFARDRRPIEQYAFRLPIDTFCDLAYFHGLIDRVGVYIGETWEGVPYQPLVEVAPQLHREELFHCTLGLRNLRLTCSTPEGLEEANELVKKWWPAALDMFGRSDSAFSESYVQWGLRQKNNADLRRQYIDDTRPLLTELGIDVPSNRLNRRFL